MTKKGEKDTHIPLYVQVRDSIKNKIISGEYPVGSVLPPEMELYKELEVSRHTIRRALAELVEEGYIKRTKRKGTTVMDPNFVNSSIIDGRNIIGLIIPQLDDNFANNILSGFLREANKKDYSVLINFNVSPESEVKYINKMVRDGVKAITIFPVYGTFVGDDIIKQLHDKGVNISFIDRNPECYDVDYVGSDNQSGGYTAARHIKMQGYKNVLFVGDSTHVSSVVDRMNGFFRGIKNYDLQFMRDDIDINNKKTMFDADYSILHFSKNLNKYRKELPFAVFCENDYYAISIMEIVQSAGIKIGEDVGVIGFDNIQKGKYRTPSLTTISQNGLLIGETVAHLTIEKLEGDTPRTVRHILPTQLVVRKSCGEDHAK